jgi:hypothetical protein
MIMEMSTAMITSTFMRMAKHPMKNLRRTRRTIIRIVD